MCCNYLCICSDKERVTFFRSIRGSRSSAICLTTITVFVEDIETPNLVINAGDISLFSESNLQTVRDMIRTYLKTKIPSKFKFIAQDNTTLSRTQEVNVKMETILCGHTIRVRSVIEKKKETEIETKLAALKDASKTSFNMNKSSPNGLVIYVYIVLILLINLFIPFNSFQRVSTW